MACATTNSAETAAPEKKDSSQPVPYTEEEFSPGLLKLRRAEVLLFGALPLFYMFSSMGYDMIVSDPPDTNDQLLQKMTITLSLSGLLSLTDFIIGEVQEKKAEKNDK